MYLLDNRIEVDPEVQSRTVDDVDEVSQRIGYTLKVRCFYRRAQLVRFLLDEFASADGAGHGNGWTRAHGGTYVLVKLANQPGRRRPRSDDSLLMHPNMVAQR